MKKRLISSMLITVFLLCIMSVSSAAAVRGDVDGNSKVTAADARLTLRCSVGLEKFNNKKTSAADMDGDGKITAADARRILRISVGLSEENAPSNDYEILRSGNFYMQGEMSSNGVYYDRMEMAFYNGTTYMTSDFNGAELGMLIKDSSIYMIYPEKKAALHMSKVLLSMAGLSSDELLSEATPDFWAMPPLSDMQKVRTEKFRNTDCTVYSYNDNDGIIEVYISGNRILRMVNYNTNMKYLSDMVINSISADVPGRCKDVPDDYKLYKGTTGMLAFMSLLENV